jgi:hypothetical protein
MYARCRPAFWWKEREGQLARLISGATPVHVISNGVDTDYFQPPRVAPGADRPAIIFTGDMSYFPERGGG